MPLSICRCLVFPGGAGRAGPGRRERRGPPDRSGLPVLLPLRARTGGRAEGAGAELVAATKHSGPEGGG
eukprot:6005978-Pyramimonas_sp.AAC.1